MLYSCTGFSWHIASLSKICDYHFFSFIIIRVKWSGMQKCIYRKPFYPITCKKQIYHISVLSQLSVMHFHFILHIFVWLCHIGMLWIVILYLCCSMRSKKVQNDLNWAFLFKIRTRTRILQTSEDTCIIARSNVWKPGVTIYFLHEAVLLLGQINLQNKRAGQLVQ
jgi:hypothetical protein